MFQSFFLALNSAKSKIVFWRYNDLLHLAHAVCGTSIVSNITHKKEEIFDSVENDRRGPKAYNLTLMVGFDQGFI